MGNVQGPDLPPYYEELRDTAENVSWKISKTREDYIKWTKPIPISYNTLILRTSHILFIMGVMCDIIISSIYASPFLLFSTNINERSTLGFMGHISFIFMYLISFMSFIGLSICLCHFCCMVCWDPLATFGPKALCKCSELWENIVCIGFVPLMDTVYICLFCSLFFVAFCISPALILYIGLWLFCRINFGDNYFGDNLHHNPTQYLTKAGQLKQRMDELNPSNDKIKTLLMKAVVHALYSRMNFLKHTKNCHTLIMYHCESATKNENALDEICDFYENHINLCHIAKLISWKETCLYSGCGVWIVLYAMVVAVFFLCFGYSENNNNALLWTYYIVSYSIFLVLFLLIVLLNYLDPLSRMKQHFAWTDDLVWSRLTFSRFAMKVNEIWDGAETYRCLQSILHQKWMAQLIIEYTIFGDVATWPSFSNADNNYIKL